MTQIPNSQFLIPLHSASRRQLPHPGSSKQRMVRTWTRAGAGHCYQQYFAGPGWPGEEFLQYAASLSNSSDSFACNPVTEDTLAYLRDPHEFRNCLMVELPKGDWAVTILRQFLFRCSSIFVVPGIAE